MYQTLIDQDHIDIVLGNPWINIYNPNAKDKITPPVSREDSLSYTTAIGLAMRAMEIK
jgi:hypothetical protein